MFETSAEGCAVFQLLTLLTTELLVEGTELMVGAVSTLL